MAHLIPLVTRLPDSAVAWIDALPAQSERRREVSAAPTGKVNWARSRQQGWPPSEFHTVVRERTPDSILTSVFGWVAEELMAIQQDAIRVASDVDISVRPELSAIRLAWESLQTTYGEFTQPDREELGALRASGRPWFGLADVAEVIISKRAHMADVARELLLPAAELRGALFHLGCLGEVLLALRGQGWAISNLRPIGIGSGPIFEAHNSRRTLEIWYEVAAAFRYYNSRSPYAQALEQLGAKGRPIGADIGLFESNERALLLECKYSAKSEYVLRNGYEQAVAYMTECHTALAVDVEGVVVGPHGVVNGEAEVATSVGPISLLAASGLEERVAKWTSANLVSERHTLDGRPLDRE
ncbi:hypothetical protein [Microbacterium gallinarum]|uniref:Uncharacterized protein n=1 Tax=Microbacterium gallinarum TaxID=2762209 RepID=A0ABR8X6M8_9MICO|nr:hypothetical protein [Microbacterium gallinarum]MBD8024868.1 hypothetical protein [Microbacterium gallinarum]